jgi:uncharacterized protein
MRRGLYIPFAEPQLPAPALIAAGLLPATQMALAIYWEFLPAFTYTVFFAVMILVAVLSWQWMGLTWPDWRRRIGWKRPNIPLALGLGLLMAAFVLASYYLILKPRMNPGPVQGKLGALGLAQQFALLILMLCFINSAFEEIYWRGFLLNQFRLRLGPVATVLAAGGLFGLHHIFVLWPAYPPSLVAVFVLKTMAAGAIWAVLRMADFSIFDCWISHIMANLAIMWTYYDLTRLAGQA